MKKFKEYYQKLNKANNLGDFPVKKDFDYTVSFIQPEMNTTEGVYRTLLPSYYLNNKTTIRALPVGSSDHMESISINSKQYAIKRALACESDHIVFPFTSQPLKNVINELKEINPKLKFSYYIDFNYYFIPDSYPFVKEYSGAEIISIIEENIRNVDQVIVTNHNFYNWLGQGCQTELCYQPLFYDKSIFPDIPANSRKKNKKKRFGMVLNPYHFSDLNFIKGILKEFEKNFNKSAELVILGWNGEYKGKNYLSQLNIEYHPQVPFFDYPEKLISLDIDCFIIPAKNNKFNGTSKNVIKFFEFTRLNKPVICPDIEPYREIITHNKEAVLCDAKENWKFELETFLKDPMKYQDFADRAYESILEKEISEEDNLKILMQIYEV